MFAHQKQSHRLTVVAGDNDHIGVICSRGDFEKDLGTEPTPDQVAQAANEHWGRPL